MGAAEGDPEGQGPASPPGQGVRHSGGREEHRRVVHERTGTTVGLPQRDGNEQALDVASDQLELRVEGSYVHYCTTNVSEPRTSKGNCRKAYRKHCIK